MVGTETGKISSLIRLPAVVHPLELLRSKLPQNLLYHAYPHTEDVIAEVVRLASLDSLSDRDTEILAVAAAWHDVGFIESPQNNEPIAAAAARKFLNSLDRYTKQEISQIEVMIRDTALIIDDGIPQQKPTTSLSRYLLDADLANFGREDFFDKSELQRREINEEPASFRQKTVALLERHVWLTPAAQELWQSKKDENLETLRKLAALA